MKRIVITAVVLIAVYIADMFICASSLSDIQSISRELTADETGAYVIAQTDSVSRIMKVTNGKILSVYEENRLGSGFHTELADTVLDGETLYAVRQTVDNGTRSIIKREIVSLELPLTLNGAQVVYSEEGILEPCSDFTLDAGALVLTTLNADGSAVTVNRITGKDTERKKETFFTQKAPFDNLFFKASFINGKIYAITKNSDIVCFEGVNLRELYQGTTGGAVFSIAPYASGIMFGDIASDSLCKLPFDNSEPLLVKTKQNLSVIGLSMTGENSFTALTADGTAQNSSDFDGSEQAYHDIYADGAAHRLAVFTNGTERVYDNISADFSVLFEYTLLRSLILLAVVLGVLILIFVLAWAYRHARRASLKALIAAVPAAAAVFAAVFAASTFAFSGIINDISAQQLLEKQSTAAEAIQRQNLAVKDTESFGKSEMYRLAEKTLKNSGCTSELYYLGGEKLYTAVSQTLPFSYPANEVCSADTYTLIGKALTDGQTVTAVSKDGFEVMAARQILSDTDTLVILSRLNINASRTAFLESIRYTLVISVAAAVLTVLIMYIIFCRVTAPLTSIKRNAPRVVGGECKAYVKKRSTDEFAYIARELNKMNTDYRAGVMKSAAAVKTYSRFVPSRLEELVGRDTAADIESGDSRRRDTTIAFISLANRDFVRGVLSDGALTQFMNSYFRLQYGKLNESGGIYVSGSFGLSASQWLFDDADNAVEASAALIQQLDDVAVENSIKASQAIILHKTTALCGVCGTDERAVPFVEFGESDFLTELAKKLGDIGTKLVMTKEQLDSTEIQSTTRRIGFVGSPDGKKRFELYEVLDVYPAEIKQKRGETAAVFTKALELYHSGDFYMARNLFSTVLRTSGDDGVARWYIFACEKYMNINKDDAQYGLFETSSAV